MCYYANVDFIISLSNFAIIKLIKARGDSPLSKNQKQ